jgi:pimeloyl-ACP methyl ester carboxylesterase
VLHHELLGDGPLVVLLHSGGMSGRQWRRLAGVLSSTNRVVVPDLLGSGENPLWPHKTPFDCSLDVEALRELLDSLGAPAHFVGHSYGGFLALALACEHRTSLRSLAVYDPVAFGVRTRATMRPDPRSGERSPTRSSSTTHSAAAQPGSRRSSTTGAVRARGAHSPRPRRLRS